MMALVGGHHSFAAAAAGKLFSPISHGCAAGYGSAAAAAANTNLAAWARGYAIISLFLFT